LLFRYHRWDIPKIGSGEQASFAVAAVGSALLGALVTLDPRVAVSVATVFVLVALQATVTERLETEVLFIMIVVSATTDIPQSVHLGPVSGLGALTLLYALVTVPFWLLNPSAMKLIPRSLRGFLGWVFILCILNSPLTVIGAQNVIVFALFAGMIGIGRHLASTDGAAFVDRIDQAFNLAGWLAVVLYGASVATGGIGSGRITGSRSFAAFALVVFGWALSRFRFERRSGALVAMIFIMIVLSLSRGALGAATGMIALAWFDMRSLGAWVKAATVAALAVAAFLFTVAHVPQLHSRFYTGDLQNVAPGIAINATGRESIWRPVWKDALTSPWIGHGPGTGDSLTAHLSGFAAGEVGAGNVHNDYLRVFHDYGLIGLFLWLATVFWLWGRLYRATSRRQDAGRWQWGAYLALVGIALEMIVDNPMIEVDVMVPLGIMIGIALAVSANPVIKRGRPTPLGQV
jgi:O-antigen ligase